MMQYQIERKVKGSRTFYFPTIKGVRLSGTNFARKYDAINLVNQLVSKIGAEKILQLCEEKAKQ
jgi:hypothetical protein